MKVTLVRCQRCGEVHAYELAIYRVESRNLQGPMGSGHGNQDVGEVTVPVECAADGEEFWVSVRIGETSAGGRHSTEGIPGKGPELEAVRGAHSQHQPADELRIIAADGSEPGIPAVALVKRIAIDAATSLNALASEFGVRDAVLVKELLGCRYRDSRGVDHEVFRISDDGAGERIVVLTAKVFRQASLAEIRGIIVRAMVDGRRLGFDDLWRDVFYGGERKWPKGDVDQAVREMLDDGALRLTADWQLVLSMTEAEVQ